MNFTSLLWLLIIINCVTQQEQQQPLVWMRSVFNRSTNKAILRCMHLIRVSIRIYMKLFLLTYDELRKSIISLNVGKNKIYRPIYSKNVIPNGNDLVLYLNCKGTDRRKKCRLAFSTNLPPCLYGFIYLTHPVITFFLIIHANCMIQSSRSLYYCKDKGKWWLLFNINPLSLIWHVCVVVRYSVCQTDQFFVYGYLHQNEM